MEMLLDQKTLNKSEIYKPKFLAYIHYLRGLAILLIVGVHCRTSFAWPEDSFWHLAFESTLDNGTIIFVFISGFLFEHLFTRNFNFKNYFNKKLKFVVGPYLLVSVIPILDKLYFENNLSWLPLFLADQSDVVKSIYMLVTGKHFGPYWFIPMIVIFYIISPFLVLINKPKFYFFIFPIIFIAGLFTYKFGYYSNTFDSFIYFLPIYLFGMFASYYKEKITQLKIRDIFLLLMIYLIITTLEVAGILEMHKLLDFDLHNVSPTYVFNFSKLKVSFLCIALILIFHKMPTKKMPFLNVLGNYSFGIFFIHLYFIVVFRFIVNRYLDNFFLTPWILILYIITICVLSILAVYTIKLIFGKNSRYVIGS